MKENIIELWNSLDEKQTKTTLEMVLAITFSSISDVLNMLKEDNIISKDQATTYYDKFYKHFDENLSIKMIKPKLQ
jgi:hypothetical protein